MFSGNTDDADGYTLFQPLMIIFVSRQSSNHVIVEQVKS